MSLGEKIIELRKKENLTQEKLSEKIGISRQTLSNWEGNCTSPDIIQAKKLSKIFRISLDDLLSIETDLECKKENDILKTLINEECYLDIDSNDYRLNYTTKVKIIDVTPEFIKIEFNYMKKSIVKLIDRELICSIKKIEGIGDK